MRWLALQKLSGYSPLARTPFDPPRGVAIGCFYISVFLFFESAWAYFSHLYQQDSEGEWAFIFCCKISLFLLAGGSKQNFKPTKTKIMVFWSICSHGHTHSQWRIKINTTKFLPKHFDVYNKSLHRWKFPALWHWNLIVLCITSLICGKDKGGGGEGEEKWDSSKQSHTYCFLLGSCADSNFQNTASNLNACDSVLDCVCMCVCVCMYVCMCAGEIRCWALVEDLSDTDER